MSGHITSSSEDEATRSESPAVSRQRKKDKYLCPADFVSFSHQPCSNTLTDQLSQADTELWLIKAPSTFSPDCFSRLKLPLSGLQTVQASAPSGRGQLYSVLGGLSGAAGLHLLTSPAQQPDRVACGPAFAGLLNVCESYGDVSSNQAPRALPAPSAPRLPPGLRQRFLPFGSKTPTLSRAEREAPPSPPPAPSPPRPSLARPPAPGGEREEERRKKKKEKKREKSAVTQTRGGGEEDGVEVKEEPVEAAAAPPNQEGAPEAPGETEERRKRKKKKRDKDRGEGEGDLLSCVVKEEVKSEPIDGSYGDVEDSGRKKKKKKKSSHDHD